MEATTGDGLQSGTSVSPAKSETARKRAQKAHKKAAAQAARQLQFGTGGSDEAVGDSGGAHGRQEEPCEAKASCCQKKSRRCLRCCQKQKIRDTLLGPLEFEPDSRF